MGPVGGHRDNMQKGFFRFVKDTIISGISNFPNNHANTHSNMNKFLIRNSLEPIPKKVINILRWF
jgi:hypothetical protein